jgi:polar amino acid transport system substrate-binding protein
MRHRAHMSLAVVLLLAALGTAACASDSNDAQAGTPGSCGSTSDLHLVKAGTLTIGTDSPAYPPWYENNKPSNGKGYESAVAYAVAKQLGFAAGKVKWTTVPFDNAIKPGSKSFDFDINQVSISSDRAKVVDFSTGYYDVNQAVAGYKDSAAAAATKVSDLKKLKLGAQVGTTSLDYINNVIKPDTQPYVYNDNNAAKAALNAKQIDAIVLDLPTALYVTSSEIKNTVVIGQLPTTGTKPEQFGLVLQMGNSLKTCVDRALAALKSNGTIESIRQRYLADAVAPTLSDG